MRLIIIIVLLTAAFLPCRAQNHQFSVVSDNDSYTSIDNDGYYTNGFELAYQWRKKNSDTVVLKRTNQIEIGQQIYNAKYGVYRTLSYIDRPITGYLYAAFQQTNYDKKQNLLRWKISAGAIGKPAFGEEVQNLIHSIVRVTKVTQWQYQLNPGFGVNATATWSPQIINKNGSPKKFDIKPIASASLGNIFTNATIGSAILIGKFNENMRSAFWDNHFSNHKKQNEFFVYFYPAIQLQGYNATVQGNIFNDNPEVFVGKLNPALFHGAAGMMYAARKYSLSYGVVYEGRQSLTQKSTHLYGSIRAAFRW